MEKEYVEDASQVTGFDIKRFLIRLIRNYIWVLASLVIFLVGAKVYLMYQVPMYEVSSFIMLDPDQLQNHAGRNINKMQDDVSGSSDNVKDIINNEIFIFHSRGLLRQVVDSLMLNVELTDRKGGDHKLISLDDVPFLMSVRRKNPESASPIYDLTLYDSYYTLVTERKRYVGNYSKPLLVDGNLITIILPDRSALEYPAEYGLAFVGMKHVVSKYVARVSVTSVPKAGVGMLEIAVQDELADRAAKIIEVLIYKYNQSNIQYNNQATRMALAFLNKRLDALDGELELQENQVSTFKAANKIYNVSDAADQLLNSLGQLDNQKSQNDLKENLLNLVESNIKSYDNGEEIVPNSNGLQDAVLFEMINKYNQLVLRKRLILDGGTAADLRLEAVNGQLDELRNSILKNVSNIRKELNANKTSLSNQERNYSSRFEVLPSKEKKYIQLNRTLGIKESLYVFLLQKREESSIQLVSSDMPRTRIIDEQISGGLVSPNKTKIYLLAFAAGLLLPAFFVMLKLIFSTRVESREEVASNTRLQIAGEIGQAPRKSGLLIASTANQSKLAEQFRSLRTNLFYISKGLPVKTIMVTSFKQGEGKSFITSNLADSIAVTGKKVIMLDFDLRKARLTEKLGLRHSLGVSELLATKMQISEVIIPLDEKNKLFFIPSGNIPDNPGELVLSDRMDTLFEYLRDNYDYILIDTAPIGVVSDAITIGNWTDLTLFIIRHNYSLRSSLSLINNLNEENKLPNLSLVINGIQSNSYQFGGYGYGYEFDKYSNPGSKRFKVV